MTNWKDIVSLPDITLAGLLTKLQQFNHTSVYVRSVQLFENNLYFMIADHSNTNYLIIITSNEFTQPLFHGNTESIGNYIMKTCPLDTTNCQVLRTTFLWTAPSSCGRSGASIGLGDRLGLASPGHIETVRNRNAKPVLAQQSIRELDLTGRNYQQVLDAASWAVFQEGYTSGFGADGDHLKKADDVRMAIDLGFSMITLDCSEHIDDSIANLTQDTVDARYASLDNALRTELEAAYLNQQFSLDDSDPIEFLPEQFRKMVLVYHQALTFAEEIYHGLLKPAHRPIDFEVSIDEVATPTTPQDHFFVASELVKRGVVANSIAPRFCGEFQKGIDYIGSKADFTTEFKVHAKIADRFGYKLSIHSGSDKFGVYDVIGQYTKGRYHVKTAGTNWLEAIRVVAEIDPGLYRDIHSFALENLDSARKYYHVTLDIDAIPPLASVTDDKLPTLMDQPDARQALHITYGLILQAKDASGSLLFRDRLYALLRSDQQAYSKRLQAHIGKHLDLLGTLASNE